MVFVVFCNIMDINNFNELYFTKCFVIWARSIAMRKTLK